MQGASGFEKPEAGRFLQIPPFPGRRVERLEPGGRSNSPASNDIERLIAAIRQFRVGGTYWAARPSLPTDYVLATSAASARAARERFGDGAIVLWTERFPVDLPGDCTVVTGECDPWHLLESATALFVDTADQIGVIAAILDVPTYLPTLEGAFEEQSIDPAALASSLLAIEFVDPFSTKILSALEAVELCGFWRRLIDSNRDIAGAVGFAFWKRDNVGPLLWGGSSSVKFDGDSQLPEGEPVAIWRSKVPATVLASLESRDTPLIEVEDGFLRSHGLGADCVPPLSITVDRLGAYFDPSYASELELLLQKGEFESDQLARARALRHAVVAAGLGKYEAGGTPLERPAGDRRHILVPGQVEDDRSVLSGGCGLVSNLELLKRVRAGAPSAHIIYKPHPDVVAGHRKGSIPDRTCLEFADDIAIETPISSLIEMVDQVHVITSLAGFEALMREKRVTTYGVPFYAGWGLTHDLGPVPSRRTAKRSLDELVAAALLIYPRYLDPVTGLPCPAEVVVQRLVDGTASQEGLVVTARRFQGKVMRRLRELAR